MADKRNVVLLRAARTLGATVTGFLVAWAAGPDALSLVGGKYQIVVTGVVVPGLVALDKWLRYGSDPGETPAGS